MLIARLIFGEFLFDSSAAINLMDYLLLLRMWRGISLFASRGFLQRLLCFQTCSSTLVTLKKLKLALISIEKAKCTILRAFKCCSYSKPYKSLVTGSLSWLFVDSFYE